MSLLDGNLPETPQVDWEPSTRVAFPQPHSTAAAPPNQRVWGWDLVDVQVAKFILLGPQSPPSQQGPGQDFGRAAGGLLWQGHGCGGWRWQQADLLGTNPDTELEVHGEGIVGGVLGREESGWSSFIPGVEAVTVA